MITITLPFPPSVNGLYAGKARRYKSPRYKAWIKSASIALSLQFRGSPTDRPIMAQIALCAPDKRKRDVTNYDKAILDLLAGVVYDDDAQIKIFSSWWDDAPGKGNCAIFLHDLDSKAALNFIETFNVRPSA